MSLPAVSIVIPVHNRAALLREALDSVAAQSFRDFETIVIDDGSDEPLGAAVEGHPAAPRVVRQARGGPGAARNRGIAEARGEFIAFLDSDDVWLPEKLQRYMDVFAANPRRTIVYGEMSPMDERGRPVAGRTKARQRGRITSALFASCFVDAPTVVARKRVLTAAGGFDASLPVCEDYDLWLRLSVDHEFEFVAEPLARRRLHESRLSKSHMSRNLGVKAEVLRHFYEAHAADGVLDRAAALRRLARAYFLAARASFQDGDYDRAAELCKEGRSLGRMPLRAYLLSWSAATRAASSRATRQTAAS